MIHIPFREDNSFSIVFLIALIVPLIFLPLLPEGYETVKYPLTLFLSGIGILILLVRKEIHIHKGALVALSGIVLLHILSTAFSLDVGNSLVGIYGRYSGSLFFILSWAALIVLVWNAIKGDEKRRLALLRVLFFDAFAISVLGIFQFFDFAYYSNTESARQIIPSFIGNQNFYAMFLVAVIPGVLVLWNNVQSKWTKYYLAVASIVIIWGIILSGSRGGVLGLAIALGVLLGIALFRKYSKVFWVGSLVMIVVSAVFYFAFFGTTRTDNIGGSSANAQYTTQARYVLWNDAWQITKDNPLLGTGPSNFFISFQLLANPKITSNERFDDAHNIVLNTTATVGIPALLAFAALVMIAFFVVWKESFYKRDSALWAISGLVGLLVAAMFNPVSVSVWVLLAIILGFATSYVTVIRPINIRIKVLSLGLAIVFMLFSVGFLSAEFLANKGVSAYRKHEDVKAQSLLRKATFLNPFNTNAKFYLIASNINVKKNYEESAKEIDSIVRAHKYSSQTYKTAADLYYRIYINTKDDKYKQAMTDLYIEAINLEKNSAPLYGAAAYAFYKTGQSDKSLEFLDKQLNLPDSTDYPYSWVVRAKIYLERNQKQEALVAMEKAYEGLSDQPLIKYFIVQLKNSAEVDKLPFPVILPDLDI